MKTLITITTFTVTFAFTLMLSACFVENTYPQSPENNNAQTQNESQTQPELERNHMKQIPTGRRINDNASNQLDASTQNRADAGIANHRDAGRTGQTTPGAGSGSGSGAGAGSPSTPDASISTTRPNPDAGAIATAHPDAGIDTTHTLFSTSEYGVLIETDRTTTVNCISAPEWSTQSIASAEFRRPSGKVYTVLIYTRVPGQIFADWMKTSEVGDAYISERTIRTASDNYGYAYTTNDMGAIPVVHITIPTDNFVYYISSEETAFEVPEDFMNFVRNLRLQ